MTKIKTLTIQFDTPLHRSEIPLFRGAVIAAIPSSNILFHNHNGTALRQRKMCRQRHYAFQPARAPRQSYTTGSSVPATQQRTI